MFKNEQVKLDIQDQTGSAIHTESNVSLGKNESCMCNQCVLAQMTIQ